MSLLFIVLGVIVIFIIWSVFKSIKIGKYLNILTEDEFREGYRKAQLIDVREPNEFKNGHILGARNIPMTQLKQRLVEIRPDKPVYLYCQGSARSQRAAQTLHKEGYEKIYQLKGGFKHWSGRIKTRNR